MERSLSSFSSLYRKGKISYTIGNPNERISPPMTFQAIDTLRRIIPSQPSSIDSTLHIWESAVLLPLIEGPKGWEILFEVRSSALTWQPGDICFPGGHREDMDRNLSDTALRETSEELGIPQMKLHSWARSITFMASWVPDLSLCGNPPQRLPSHH